MQDPQARVEPTKLLDREASVYEERQHFEPLSSTMWAAFGCAIEHGERADGAAMPTRLMWENSMSAWARPEGHVSFYHYDGYDVRIITAANSETAAVQRYSIAWRAQVVASVPDSVPSRTAGHALAALTFNL